MAIYKLAALLVSAAAINGQMINNKTMVDSINANPNNLWKAGFSSRFHSQTIEEFRRNLGVKGDWGAAAAKFPRIVSAIRNEEIPESFDSATNWPQCATVIGDIRDQSMCGCCWAFAGAEAASDRLCISTNGSVAVPLSAQDVCFCASDDGCDGGQIDTPWEYIQESGAVTGGQFNNTYALKGGEFCSDFSLPHCHHHGPQGNDPYPAEGAPGCPQQTSPRCPKKCDADASSAHSDFSKDKWSFDGEVGSAEGESEIQKAIMEGGPVETAFTVYSDFANYVSGIYHHTSGGMEGGHAVRFVGWGVENGNKYWKVANSWNPYWGEKGYFRIKRGNNECGIEDGVTFSPAGAKWSSGQK